MESTNNLLNEEEEQEFKALGINIVDQSSLEEKVEFDISTILSKHERKQKLQLLKKELNELKIKLLNMRKQRANCQTKLSWFQRQLNYKKAEEQRSNLADMEKEIMKLNNRIGYINDKVNLSGSDQSVLDEIDLNLEEGEILEIGDQYNHKANSAELITKGEMTPFGSVLHSNCSVDNFVPQNVQEFKQNLEHKKVIVDKFNNYFQDQLQKQHLQVSKLHLSKKRTKSTKHGTNSTCKKIKLNGSDTDLSINSQPAIKTDYNPLKKSILHPKRHWKEGNLGTITSEKESDMRKRPGKVLSESFEFKINSSGSEYFSSDTAESDDQSESASSSNLDKIRNDLLNKANTIKKKAIKNTVDRVQDDGNIKKYEKRLNKWKKAKLKEKHDRIINDMEDIEGNEYETFDKNFKIPISVWNKLYKFQKTGVKWLWELHCQLCGGILGDEMGLGKTIMIISFLVGLSVSNIKSSNNEFQGLGPVLIVCPTTVLQQWVREFHTWWPQFRVAVLHSSGSHSGEKSSLIRSIHRNNGIIVSSYRGIVKYLKTLNKYNWHYVILDEGHQIRNPDAQVTVAVKQFVTPHRLILSGSPIQNSLKELWSLFDFVFPGKLGSLQVFLQQFSVPITVGGYANATKLEVQTAFKCATMLRDTINPYLLRRMKKDVKNHLTLPNKTEQVLFCGLTDEQRALYKGYLDGNDVKCIFSGRLKVFVGLIKLRKICNHSDLYSGGPKHFGEQDSSNLNPEDQYGYYGRSGKMVVLATILKLWKKQGHRVLLFSQTRQMMCILEKFLIDYNYKYLQMSGNTSVGSRQPLIRKFNTDESIFVFLLTTRVGGVGVNLTGADRVVIFDPDWNPSTDTQARERAWRIGQTKHVTIYRLLTAGTIEEKIYHRQIFKQFLTNRVLEDPKQQRFFKSNDLFELFTLKEGTSKSTESEAIFAGLDSKVKVKNKAVKHDLHALKKLSKGKSENRSKNSYSQIWKEGVGNIESKNLDEEMKCSKDNAIIAKPNEDTGAIDQTILQENKNNSAIEESTRKLSIIDDSKTQLSIVNKATSQMLNSGDDDEIAKETPIIDKHKSEDSIVSKNDKPVSQRFALNNSILDKSITDDDRSGKSSEKDAPLKNSNGSSSDEVVIDEARREKLRQLAKVLSKKISSSNKSSHEYDKIKDDILADLKKPEKKNKQKNDITGRLLSKNNSEKAIKNRKKKGKYFEGERIENLVKIRKYKNKNDPGESSLEKEKISNAQDGFVLQKLLKKSGLHTALSHDAIVNTSDPDYLLLEAEAERIATEALNKVRLSREQFSSNFSNRKKSKTFGNKKNNVLMNNGDSRIKIGSSKMFSGGGMIGEDENNSETSALAKKISDKMIKNSETKLETENTGSRILTSSQLLKRMQERNKINSTVRSEHSGSNDARSTNLPIRAQSIGIHGSNTSSSRRNANVNFAGPEPYRRPSNSQNREVLPSSSLDNESFIDDDDPEKIKNVELLTDIRNFVAFQSDINGRATTEEILEKFKNRLPSNENHIFRALLKQICYFKRHEVKREGVWYIKEEFR